MQFESPTIQSFNFSYCTSNKNDKQMNVELSPNCTNVCPAQLKLVFHFCSHASHAVCFLLRLAPCLLWPLFDCFTAFFRQNSSSVVQSVAIIQDNRLITEQTLLFSKLEIAKLSPKPQPQLGAEVVIFLVDPTTQPASHPTTHPDKFKLDLKQRDSKKQSSLFG